MAIKIKREQIVPILERKAREIREKYENESWEFLGGRFPVQLGIYGYWVIHLNSNYKIMKIETPEGAYLRP